MWSSLVLPSVLEGFGRVILEAFAMYKPVLASNIKSISEVIDDSINGFLISPYDVEMWAEKIKFMLSNHKESIAMGINGRRKVEQYFDLEYITDRMEEYIQRHHSLIAKGTDMAFMIRSFKWSYNYLPPTGSGS